MNLVNDNDRNKTSNASKTNKIFLILIVIILITIMIIMSLLMIISEKMSNVVQSAILVDGVQIKNLQIDDVKIENETLFFPIEDIAKSIGYKFYKGEYKIPTEDVDKCYVMNEYESASFFENKNYVYKFDLTNNQTSEKYKEYKIQNPVKSFNGKLYVSSEGLSIACNVKISYDSKNQKIDIYTLEGYFEKKFEELATENGLTLSQSQSYENKKAMLKDWAVVQDASQNYGIINGKGTEILGLKYKNIEYDDYVDVFQVTDTSRKVGIWKIENNSVSQKIKNSYDSIALIDKDKELYLVSSNNQYGVITFDEKIVGQIIYDKVGIDTTKYDVEDRYIMYDKLIPVQKDGKWGILDIEEKSEVLPLEYDGIGCDVSNQKNLENIVMVPEYGLIVLQKESQYGLINWKCEKIIDFVLSSIYYSNASGSKLAYMESAGEKYEVVKYLDDDGRIERYENNKENDIFSDFNDINNNSVNINNEIIDSENVQTIE